MLGQAGGELVGEVLAKEGDVRLHHPSLDDIVLGLLGAAITIRPPVLLLLGAGRPLPLDALGGDTHHLGALGAAWDDAGLDVGEDGLALGLEAALDAAGGAKGAVALDELVLGDAGLDLEVVDVLGVVGQQLAALVQHGDELVGGRVAVRVGDDVLGDLVEDGGILLEDANVKDLLRVVEAEILELRVQAGALGAEVGDAQRRGDAGAGEQDDVAAPVDEVDGVVDRVVAAQLGALGQLPRDGQQEQLEVVLVGPALEEGRALDAEGAEQLLGRVAAGVDGALAEDGRAVLAQLATETAGLFGRARACV